MENIGGESQFNPSERQTMMQFFREKINKNLHEKQVEQKEFLYPGIDPFEALKSKEELPKEGIIFNLKFTEGFEAVGNVIVYDNLESAEFDESENYLHFSIDGKTLYFGIENPESTSKDVEPYNRMSPSSYIPLGFENLDKIKLKSESRLLLEESLEGVGLSARLDNSDTQFSRVFERKQIDDLGKTIAASIQQKLGLSEQDAIEVATEVVYKVFDAEKKVDK